MDRFRTVGLVAIGAASLVVACNDDAIPTIPTLTRAPQFEATWVLQPRVSLDCGRALLVVDTVKTAVDTVKRGWISPGWMEFMVKGYFYPSNRPLEYSVSVNVNTQNAFTFHGERTYSYGGFRFQLVGRFVDTSSFSAVLTLSGHYGADRRIGCEQGGHPVSVIGQRIR